MGRCNEWASAVLVFPPQKNERRFTFATVPAAELRHCRGIIWAADKSGPLVLDHRTRCLWACGSEGKCVGAHLAAPCIWDWTKIGYWVPRVLHAESLQCWRWSALSCLESLGYFMHGDLCPRKGTRPCLKRRRSLASMGQASRFLKRLSDVS